MKPFRVRSRSRYRVLDSIGPYKIQGYARRAKRKYRKRNGQDISLSFRIIDSRTGKQVNTTTTRAAATAYCHAMIALSVPTDETEEQREKREFADAWEKLYGGPEWREVKGKWKRIKP